MSLYDALDLLQVGDDLRGVVSPGERRRAVVLEEAIDVGPPQAERPVAVEEALHALGRRELELAAVFRQPAGERRGRVAALESRGQHLREVIDALVDGLELEVRREREVLALGVGLAQQLAPVRLVEPCQVAGRSDGLGRPAASGRVAAAAGGSATGPWP